MKRSHQKLNGSKNGTHKNRKRSLWRVFVISTEEDEERVTNIMFEIFDKELPMNQLPQCLWANVMADISGPNADPKCHQRKQLRKRIDGPVGDGLQTRTRRHQRTKCFATVEVKTIRNLDMRVAECDNKSQREMLRGVVSTMGDKHRLITQCDHKVDDPETVVVTCRARDLDKVQVLMKRWAFFVTSHYKEGWAYFKDGVQDHLMEIFVQ